MKLLIVLSALVCLATVYGAFMHGVIKHEVTQLVGGDPTMSVEDCTNRCDALFNLIVEEEENKSDDVCAMECRNAILGTTTRHHHSHHSHPQHHHTKPMTTTTIP